MRLKIWCDGWKRKYFGFACQLNRALARCARSDFQELWFIYLWCWLNYHCHCSVVWALPSPAFGLTLPLVSRWSASTMTSAVAVRLETWSRKEQMPLSRLLTSAQLAAMSIMLIMCRRIRRKVIPLDWQTFFYQMRLLPSFNENINCSEAKCEVTNNPGLINLKFKLPPQ
jgi:hypothetical protein